MQYYDTIKLCSNYGRRVIEQVNILDYQAEKQGFPLTGFYITDLSPPRRHNRNNGIVLRAFLAKVRDRAAIFFQF
jgi:hypothetical protein